MKDPNIDPNANAADPNGQPDNSQGNDPGQGTQPNPSPTDFVDFKGVKIPASEFESLAKERFKDRFEAYDNREKWQAENTRKAQEIKAIQRDAETFRNLKSDPRYQALFGQQAPAQNQKQAYVERKSRQFPEVDPRFFESQYDDMMEVAGMRAQQEVSPIVQRHNEEWEKSFLQSHPLVKPNTEKYDRLADFLEQNPRIDPEAAYEIVYKDEILEKLVEDRIKARDVEVTRKLKSTSPATKQGQRPRSFDDAFEQSWSKHGSAE